MDVDEGKKRQYRIIYMQVEGGRVLLFILNSSSKNVNLLSKYVSNELNINLSNAQIKAFFVYVYHFLEQLRFTFCL